MAEYTAVTSLPKQEHSGDISQDLAEPVTDGVQAYSTAPVQQAKPLERYISFKPILALGLTVQSSWEVIAVTFQSAFLNGGPVSLVYGAIIVTLGSASLAATLGEMAAVDPAVGAQYRWSARYAPANLRPHFWGFMQGWLTLVAWIVSCASTPYVLGTVIQAVIQFNDPTYVPERWHATLLMWAFIVLAVVWNFYARRLLVAVEIVGGILHLVFFFAIAITLGVLVPRSSNDFVWRTSVSGVSGWNDPGVCFCIGLLSPALSVGGFDGIIHMSDETKNAPSRVPRGMVATVLINGLLAFTFSICLLYTLGDPTVTLDPTRTSLPIIMVFYNATGSVAVSNLLMSFIIIVVTFGNLGIFASVSRLTWAFAKDGGLPFAKFFAYVHPGLQVPVNALCLVGMLCALLALINIGSTVAFYAIISLAVLALFISYMPPVVFLLIRKLKGERLAQGPFSLGRLGIAINIFGLCYAVFMVVWLPFPTTIPVTGPTMNYAGPIWVGCVLLGVVDYVFFGHKRFQLKT